jgi:glycosyltransferase involved in cell wall biosynthesis
MRVLVMTLPPFDGGVPFKARQLCLALRAQGHDVTVATYATFHHQSHLNWSLLSPRNRHRPSSAPATCFGDFPAIFVGCWLPELEATYTLPSRRWDELIGSFDRHVAVGGTPIMAHALAASQRPFLLWCASDVAGDRHERQKRMGWLRRSLDRAVIAPWLRRIEKYILSQPSGQVRVVSKAAHADLLRRGCASDRLAPMPIPIELDAFSTPTTPPRAGTIGFAGRFNDPRKNIGLLIEMMRLSRERGLDLKLHLAGAEASHELSAEVKNAGLGEHVLFLGELPRDQLVNFYRGLDIFVIPSQQEGLCVSGLEAMACGIPVITTPCGGPLDYVMPGRTGFIASTPSEMLDHCQTLVNDRNLRQAMSAAARQFVSDHYSFDAFQTDLSDAWRRVWGEEP